MRWIRLGLIGGALALPAHAAAQQTVNDVIGFLVTNQAVQTADFERDQAAAEAARDTMTRALLVNLTSVPLASSSGGFLYRFNPQLGTMERTTESFGGFFVERALTAGAGRGAFAVSGATRGFTELDGRDLRDGTLVTVANAFRDEDEPFDVETLALRLRTTTVTMFASYGLTDRLDIGGALPFVRLSLDGERVSVYRGSTSQQASGTASASGLGDVALRAKYALVSGVRGGLAAAAELRLPTGDEENLLGAGSTSYRLMGIGSFEEGRLGLHGNVAIVRGGIAEEFNAGGAASLAVTPRVTLSGEVLLRHVPDLRESVLSSAPHPTIAGVDTLRLTAGPSGTTMVNAVTGFKWNASGALVLGGYLSWPMGGGLTAPVTPSFNLEYAF